jgi:hypothetical protein
MPEKYKIINLAINVLGDNFHTKGRALTQSQITFQGELIIVKLYTNEPKSYTVIFDLLGRNKPSVEIAEKVETIVFTKL